MNALMSRAAERCAVQFVLALVGILLAAASARAGYEGVCREASALGFEGHKQRALKIFDALRLPRTVGSFNETAVYVEAYEAQEDPQEKRTIPAGLYFHSNYVTSGYSYPTKVAFPTNDMAAALENIFSDKPPLSGKIRDKFLQALDESVALIFNVNVMESDLAPLELGNIQRFFVTDGRSATVEVRRRRRGEVLHCHIESPCWDKEKWEVVEACDTEKASPIVAIINAVLQGAISGFQCVVQKR